jgi:hypothetical protein
MASFEGLAGRFQQRSTSACLAELLTPELLSLRAWRSASMMTTSFKRSAETKRIQLLRDDPHDRPWVKMAALQCLVEIEREKLAREADAQKNHETKSDSQPSGTPDADDAP